VDDWGFGRAHEGGAGEGEGCEQKSHRAQAVPPA
jgi:hypothetical protein